MPNIDLNDGISYNLGNISSSILPKNQVNQLCWSNGGEKLSRFIINTNGSVLIESKNKFIKAVDSIKVEAAWIIN